MNKRDSIFFFKPTKIIDAGFAKFSFILILFIEVIT